MKLFKKSHTTNKKTKYLKIASFFAVFGAFFVSTAYALSNQLFTVSGSATIIDYGVCPTDISFAYEIISSWGDSNNGYTYHAKLSVKNNSNTRVDGWTMTLKGPSDLSVKFVNAEVTVDNGEVTFNPTGNYVWAASIEPGSTREIDFQVSTAEPTLNLEYLYFNSCMVITGGNSSPLRDFTVEPEQISIKKNQTAAIKVRKMPVDARADFVFSSNNTSVAIVDTNGVVTGIAPGTATITASSGTIARAVQVSVVDDHVVLTALTASVQNNKMKVGDEQPLIITKDPADAGDIINYSSSNPSIATVDASGKITAIKEGLVTITASAGDLSSSVNLTIIRDALHEDIEATFSYMYYDSNNIQFTINLANVGHSEIHKITFKISFPSGTTWNYWNNYPAMFVADSTGTTLTSTNSNLLLERGSYINFTGNVTLPNGYSSTDYLDPTIYDIRVEED